MTGPPRVKAQCGLNTVKAGVFRRGPATRGLHPKSKPPLLEVVLIFRWRRRRDSNPRTRERRVNGFRDRRIQPLCHSSVRNEQGALPEKEVRPERLLAESRGFEPRRRFWRLHDFQSCSFGQLGHICKYCFDIITYQSKKSNNYLALFLTSSSFAKYTEREVKAKSIFISSARVLTSQLNFDLKVR